MIPLFAVDPFLTHLGPLVVKTYMNNKKLCARWFNFCII